MPPVAPSVHQIAVVGATAAEISALSRTAGVTWLLCKHAREQIYEFWDGDRCLSRLDMSDALCELSDLLAIIGKPDDPAFVDIQSAWLECLPGRLMIFVPRPDFEPMGILASALDVVARALTTQRQQSGRFALDLATYRDEFDRLQHNFAALESYMTTTVASAPREVFSYPVGIDNVDLVRDSGRAKPGRDALVLQQLLPINSLGVSGVAISLSSVPSVKSPPLRLALRAIETNALLGAWVLDSDGATPGWSSFVLDRAIDEIALTLVLEIVWPSESGWRVDLGPPHPNEAMCARTRLGERQFLAPIAMRVLSTIPGSTPVATTDAIFPGGARRSPTSLVSKAAYESITTITAQSANDMPLVIYDREAGFIQVHPEGPGRVTIARIAVTAPIPAWRLTARTHLAHEKAHRADFGLMVRRDDEPPPDPMVLIKERKAQPGFSGWQSLDALQHGTLSVLLPELEGRRMAVYLMTKQNAPPDFAWARFSDLQLHLGPAGRLPAVGRRDLSADEGEPNEATETAATGSSPGRGIEKRRK